MDGHGAIDIHEGGLLTQGAQVGRSHKVPVAILHIHVHPLILVVQRDIQRGAYARVEVDRIAKFTLIGLFD